MIRTFLFFLLLLAVQFTLSQSINPLDLKKPALFNYRNSILVAGLYSQDNEVKLAVLLTDTQFVVTHEAYFDLGKGDVEDFNSLLVDSFHNRITIFVQLKSKKQTGKLLRLNPKLEILIEQNDFPFTQLNTFFAFDTDVFYSANSVYSVRKISADSSRQFLLRKYSLRNANKLNEAYVEDWQFSFKGSEYNFIQVLGAGMDRLWVLVHATQGARKGQWFMQINAKSGRVISATKIPITKINSDFYLHTFFADSVSSIFFLAGTYQDTLEIKSQIDQRKTKSFSNLIFGIDTASNLILQSEFKMPIPAECANARKFTSMFFNAVRILKTQDKFVLCGSLLGEIQKGIQNEIGIVFAEFELISPNELKWGPPMYLRTDYSERKDPAYLTKQVFKYQREGMQAGMFFKDPLQNEVNSRKITISNSEFIVQQVLFNDKTSKKSTSLQLVKYSKGKISNSILNEFPMDGIFRNCIFLGDHFLLLKQTDSKAGSDTIKIEKINFN